MWAGLPLFFFKKIDIRVVSWLKWYSILDFAWTLKGRICKRFGSKRKDKATERTALPGVCNLGLSASNYSSNYTAAMIQYSCLSKDPISAHASRRVSDFLFTPTQSFITVAKTYMGGWSRPKRHLRPFNFYCVVNLKLMLILRMIAHESHKRGILKVCVRDDINFIGTCYR